MNVVGIVLAAGAGSRFGGPKALARTAGGEPWVARAVATLTDAGCDPVLVALGAARAEAALLVPATAQVIAVPDWADGLSASLTATLAAAASTDADAALIIPVDVPDLPASVCRRVLAAGAGAPSASAAPAPSAPAPVPETRTSAETRSEFADCSRVSADRRVLGANAQQTVLARAVYGGAPGHPALIGRAHWAAIGTTGTGDRGAGPYLAAHGATPVECGDLWHGRDVDVRNNSS